MSRFLLPVCSTRVASIVLGLVGLAVLHGVDPAVAEERAFKGTVLDQVSLGHLPAGERSLKMTLFEMQPGAEVPPHTHAAPGMRYVLQGAIEIASKDGTKKTFEAGSTYFEGAGENHPAGQISAQNVAEGVTRVLIVELMSAQ